MPKETKKSNIKTTREIKPIVFKLYNIKITLLLCEINKQKKTHKVTGKVNINKI